MRGVTKTLHYNYVSQRPCVTRSVAGFVKGFGDLIETRGRVRARESTSLLEERRVKTRERKKRKLNNMWPFSVCLGLEVAGELVDYNKSR